MIGGLEPCNCGCIGCPKKIQTNKEKNIVKIQNGDDEYVLCNPARKNQRFIPAIHNGNFIHVTKEEAITLLIDAAAKRTYENI